MFLVVLICKLLNWTLNVYSYLKKVERTPNQKQSNIQVPLMLQRQRFTSLWTNMIFFCSEMGVPHSKLSFSKVFQHTALKLSRHPELHCGMCVHDCVHLCICIFLYTYIYLFICRLSPFKHPKTYLPSSQLLPTQTTALATSIPQPEMPILANGVGEIMTCEEIFTVQSCFRLPLFCVSPVHLGV